MDPITINITHGSNVAGLRIPTDIHANLGIPVPTADDMRDSLLDLVKRYVTAEFSKRHPATQAAQPDRTERLEAELPKVEKIE